MGLFDIFTGKPAKEAAAQQRAYLGQIGTQNNSAIDSGLTNSLGALGTGYNTGTGAVNQAYGDASGYLNQAGAAYDPLAALGGKYGGATTMGLNALGVNGAQGQQDARAAFQAGPAYNFNLEQGLESINRRRNMGGMLDSGNADRDAQTFGAGLASNEYDKWVSGLQARRPDRRASTPRRRGLRRVAGRCWPTYLEFTGKTRRVCSRA